MNKITYTLRTSILSLVAISALAGCASTPDPSSFGGRLALEGGEVAKIGADWNVAQEQVAQGRELIEDGQSQIKKGEKQIASGEDNVDEGQTKIRRGERLIADGETKAARAEEKYARQISAAAARVKTPDPTGTVIGSF